MSDITLRRLRERVKELTALHRTARIRFRDQEYAIDRFRETPWMQRVDCVTRSGKRGSITVVYLEERPTADEGPFRAEMLCSHLEHSLAVYALREARDALEAKVLVRTIDLRRLTSRLTLAEARERHGRDPRLLDQTIRDTRELAGDISPPVLYELGLEPALDWLAEQFTEKRRFRVRLRTRDRARIPPEELAVMLFTSARELLINSFKHSGESEAALHLVWDGD